MKIIYNRFIPFRGFKAMNLFGILFVRLNSDGTRPYLSKETLNHERIHTEQMKEMLYIFFYIWYFIEWLVELVLPPYNKAYKEVSFEEEARINQYDESYLEKRRHYSWTKYVFDLWRK